MRRRRRVIDLPSIMRVAADLNPGVSRNRRVQNATPTVAEDGVQMRSKLEARIYNTLLNLGFNPRYEQETFIYWEGPRPTVPFYDLGKGRRLRLNMTKLVDMKYTPDIIFDYEGIKVIIEVKGYANDQFAIRKKMFRAFLETLDYPVIYAEIFTKKQLMEFLEVLKQYKLEDNGEKVTV